MSGSTSIVDAAPPFVPGTFDGQDVRLATIGNALPGLFAAGDFAVTQRAAGANASVDIAAGRCYVDPGAVARQGVYMPWMGTAYNTSTNGGYVWTAQDATNNRIDMLCIEINDTDFSGTYTGFKFRVVDGTPNASVAHQLDAQYWPAVPTGCVPVAAILQKSTANGGTGAVTTANITNLNAIGGVGRSPSNGVVGAETTTSSSYARLATPDFVCVYVPHANARIRIGYKAHWKVSASSGVQSIAAFIDGAQVKQSLNAAVPSVLELNMSSVPLATVYSHVSTTPMNNASGSADGFYSQPGSGIDVTDVATGQTTNVNIGGGSPHGPIEVFGLPAGWHLIEVKVKTTANTLSLRNRFLIAEVVG